MVRLVIFALLACSTYASDDHSLLQSGVGVSAGEVQQAVHYLTSKMTEMPYPGKMRQMAIDALMQSVNKVEKLDADAIELLNEIVQLLKDILDDMKLSNDVDQGVIDAILGVNTNCAATNDHDAGGKQTAAEAAGVTHKTCRATEHTERTDQAVACGAAADWMESFQFQHCAQLPDGSDTHLEWTTYFTHYESVYNTNKDTFSGLSTQCKDATTTQVGQTEICNQAQNLYENKFCSWWQALTDTCSGLATCYASAVSLHGDNVASIRVNADKRVNEARVIEHVKCLVTELATGSATLPGPCATTTASEETTYQDKYNVTHRDVPDASSCDDSPVDVHPGTATWFETQYTDEGIEHWVVTTTSC